MGFDKDCDMIGSMGRDEIKMFEAGCGDFFDNLVERRR